MLWNKLHFFPIFIVIYFPVTFFITYGIAVYEKHVYPDFPFISDTGTTPPESCVFGQLLNIAAVIAMFVFYVRYKQIATYQRDRPNKAVSRVNTAALVIGLLTAFGISLVGNFQETEVLVVHLIGASLAFLLGSLYCCLQTYISFKLPDIPGTSTCLRITRVVICVLDIAFFVALAVASRFTSNNSVEKKPTCWTREEPEMSACLTSTVSEWIIAFLICVYIATLSPEFKYFELIKPTIHFHEVCGNNEEPAHNLNEPRTNGDVVSVPITTTSAKY
uniref:DNA damage-regulated autophagy modulator protein 1-like n=1 Tax=Crassostrea virginica TaxID=6565 RepID=A0A8B8DC70_CRAVI|nr:DNA damage-regulated autophagy modulator protein 1-like [Crassostrea virginica]